MKDSRLQITNYRLQITDCRVQIADYRLQITDCRPQTADYRLQTTDCRLQTADYRLQITDCRLQTTDRKDSNDIRQTVGGCLRLDGLCDGADLVDLEQQTVARLLLHRLLDALWVGHRQVITHHLEDSI